MALLVAAVVAALLFLDANTLRGPIGRIASARAGREITLAGDLTLHPWSLQPSATVGKLQVADAKWAKPGHLADIESLSIKVKLLPLLVGRLDLVELAARNADLKLRRDRQGRANWDFSNGRKSTLKLPAIRRFVVEDGRLDYVDEKRGLRFKGRIDARETQGGRNRGFELSGDGSINGKPFRAEMTGGPLLRIDASRPYPFDADIRAGATHLIGKGQITKPFDLGGISLVGRASGADLADLYDLTGVPLPNTPPYQLAGSLVRKGRVVTISGIQGRIGDSDLAGGLSVDSTGPRSFLKADLKTRSLDLDDVSAIFGGAPSRAKGETVSAAQAATGAKMAAERRIFPDATLKVDRIRAIDADVRYAAASIRSPQAPLRSGSVRVRLDNGLLTADPFKVELPKGQVAGRLTLNARNATPVTDLDLRLTGGRLEQFIPIAGTPLTGSVVARVKLKGSGDSVRRAFAAADGEVLVVVPGGEIRAAFAELLGINVTKGLGLLWSDNQDKVPIRCAVAHFDAKAGVLNADRIIFDTGPVLGTGSGSVNLGTEQLDLKLEGHPKELRLVRILAPITVRGPITGPKVGIEKRGIFTQGGISAVLATFVAPLAVVLPFIDPGLAEDASCGALIAQARKDGAPVKSARR